MTVQVLQLIIYIKEVVKDIESHLNNMQTSLSNIQPLVYLLDRLYMPSGRTNSHLVKECWYSEEERKEYLGKLFTAMEQSNEQQFELLLAVLYAINNVPTKEGKVEKLFVINAAAGTGKTFTNDGAINYIRYYDGTNVCCIAVSTTAISAQLLLEGYTAHSTFKLPIRIDESNRVRCGIDFNSPLVEMLKKARMLVWDEAMSARKELVEAVIKFF